LAWKRHRNARVAAWIAFDRLLEIVVTLCLGVVGLWLMTLVPSAMALVASGVVATAIATALWLLTRRAFLLRLARRFGVRTRLRAALRALAAVSREARHFKRTLLPTAVITVAMKVVDLGAVVLLFSALGAHPGFWIVAASKCALAIVSFLPVTPPATMIPHGVQAWILHEEAGVPYEILAAVIGIEVVMISVTFWTSFGFTAGGLRRALGAETPNPMKLS
jgi:hypothetical protein